MAAWLNHLMNECLFGVVYRTTADDLHFFITHLSMLAWMLIKGLFWHAGNLNHEKKYQNGFGRMILWGMLENRIWMLLILGVKNAGQKMETMHRLYEMVDGAGRVRQMHVMVGSMVRWGGELAWCCWQVECLVGDFMLPIVDPMVGWVCIATTGDRPLFPIYYIASNIVFDERL
jgi:hypothetical protein